MLRSQERLVPAAWLASLAHCLSQVVLHTNLEQLVDPENCMMPLAQHCRDAFTILPPAPACEPVNEDTDPLDWNDWVRRPRKKLQKLLSKRFDEKLFTTLLATMDVPFRARLHSCSGPFASAWQWAAHRQPR